MLPLKAGFCFYYIIIFNKETDCKAMLFLLIYVFLSFYRFLPSRLPQHDNLGKIFSHGRTPCGARLEDPILTTLR